LTARARQHPAPAIPRPGTAQIAGPVDGLPAGPVLRQKQARQQRLKEITTEVEATCLAPAPSF